MGRLANLMRDFIPRDIPTGTVAISDISVELGTDPMGQRSLDQADGRELVGIPTSGTEISLNDFRGTGTGVKIQSGGVHFTSGASTGMRVYEVYPFKAGVGWVDCTENPTGWTNLTNPENYVDQDFGTYATGDRSTDSAYAGIIIEDRLVNSLRCKFSTGNDTGVRARVYYKKTGDTSDTYPRTDYWQSNSANAELDLEYDLVTGEETVHTNTGWIIYKPVTGISITSGDWNYQGASGGTSQIAYTITPPDATNLGVTFESGNTGVVTVNSTGLMTAVGTGSTTVTIKSVDNPSITDSINVSVALNIALNKAHITIRGDSSQTAPSIYEIHPTLNGSWIGKGTVYQQGNYFTQLDRMNDNDWNSSADADEFSPSTDVGITYSSAPVTQLEYRVNNEFGVGIYEFRYNDTQLLSRWRCTSESTYLRVKYNLFTGAETIVEQGSGWSKQ